MKDWPDLGVNKVAINTLAGANPELMKEGSRGFGRENLVVALGGRKYLSGSEYPLLEVVIGSGGEATGMDIVD